MVAFVANPGFFVWRAPHGRGGSFRPQGKLYVHDPLDIFNWQKNPELWEREKPVQAARLITGFNVGGIPTWTIEDVMRIVKDVRKRQVGDPASSFIAQKGIYQHKTTKEIVEEDGAQVLIIDVWDTPPEEFRAQMVKLAEELARNLQQEEIVVELQKDGIAQKVIGVGP